MNGIFPYFICYGQKPNFLFGSGKDEIGTIFLKSDICDPFWSVVIVIIMLNTSCITKIYFILNLIAKYIAIFKIWMYNSRMVLANLGQVVRKEMCRTNKKYKRSEEGN